MLLKCKPSYFEDFVNEGTYSTPVSNLSGLMTGLWKWPDSRQSFRHWELHSAAPCDWDIRFYDRNVNPDGDWWTCVILLPCWFRSLTSTPDSKSCAIGKKGSRRSLSNVTSRCPRLWGALPGIGWEITVPQFLEALAEGKAKGSSRYREA